MRVLMISRDIRAKTIGSSVNKRFEDYGKLVDSLRIVVLDAPGAIRDIVKSGSVDLVTSQNPFEAGFAGWVIAIVRGAKLEVQLHTDCFSEEFWRQNVSNKIKKILAWFVLRRADVIRVVSLRLKTSLLKWGISEERIYVLPIPVITSESVTLESDGYYSKKYPGKKVIMVASRLTGEKDIKTIIKAFYDVTKKHADVILSVVGEGPQKKDLEGLVQSCGLGDKVFFEGWRNDLGHLYREASMYVSSSLYEGYGLTFFEALSAGCPVVTTAVGAIGFEISKDSVWVFNIGDSKGCAAAMERCLLNDKLKDQKIQRGFDDVARLKTYKQFLDGVGQAWNQTRAK